MPDERSGRRRASPLFRLTAALVVLQMAVTTVSITSRSLNADDVWIQLWWSRWRPFQQDIALSRNTWVLHAPIAWAAELVLGRGIAALVVAAVILNVVGLLLVIRFSVFLTGRLGAAPRRALVAVGISGLWLILLSPLFASFTARVNFRNIEIGLALLVVQSLVTLAEDTRPRVGPVVGLALLIGVLCFDDPWFFYAGVAPGIALIALRWTFSTSTPTEHRMLRFLVAGAVAVVVVRAAFAVAGVTITDYAPPVVAQFDQLPARAFGQLGLLLALFGADLGGRDLRDAETLLHLARAGVLATVALAIWRTQGRVASTARPVVAALAVVVGAGFAAATVSELGGDLTNVRFARYLVPVAALIGVASIVPLVVGSPRVRAVVALVVLASSATVSISIARLAVDRARDGVDGYLLDEVRSITDELEADGYRTGYADFMGGMALDYWSDGDIDVAIVGCGPDGLENSALSPVDDHAPPTGPSFVLHLTRAGLPGCTDDTLRAALGVPVATRTTEFFTVTTYEPAP